MLNTANPFCPPVQERGAVRGMRTAVSGSGTSRLGPQLRHSQVGRLVRSILQSMALCYSGPCNLRPLHLTIPSILRPAISDTILIFSV